MKEMKITSFKQVKQIVDAAARCEKEINVQDVKGSLADAKSILGLMNLDYNFPVQLTGDDPDEVENVYNAIIFQ